MKTREAAATAAVTAAEASEDAPAESARTAPLSLVLLVTWFGCGMARRAPGTVGTLGAVPFAWIIAWGWGQEALAAAAVVAFLIGWAASEGYVRIIRRKDPGEVVIDEVAAVWVVLALAPLDPAAYALGFLFFRVADIFKPWPVRWADRRLGGGFGIMIDDMIAAAYAAPFLLVAVQALGIGG